MYLRDVVVFYPNGSIGFKVAITIKTPNGSVSLTPGISFTRGISFGGIDYDWIVAHLNDRIN